MLYTPIDLGKIKLANRLVMAPMETGNTKNGAFTEKLLKYYEDRAGKLGLIISEHAYVREDGQAAVEQLRIDDKADMAGFRELVRRVHKKGDTKIIQQINHCGEQTKALKNPISVNKLFINDIADLKDAYVKAALKVKEVGFDGVEVHVAHGYLLSQFYSPLRNHRDDMYGGNLEKRLRFPLEVVAAVRKAVGEAFPLFVRLGACDYQEGGNTLSCVPQACKAFQEVGCDVMDISGGVNGFMRKGAISDYYIDASTIAKEVLSIPVIVTGGIRGKDHMEELLNKGVADFIGIGRPLLNDTAILDELF